MTSNLGGDFLANLGENEDVDSVRAPVMDAVRAHFRPEFLNRLDDIILFHRLKRQEMSRIVDIQLKRLQKLLDDRKVTLDLDAEARSWLAEKGYDPTYGARPLKRVIQREVQGSASPTRSSPARSPTAPRCASPAEPTSSSSCRE